MRWSYKTIHYELKKDGLLGSAFLDESEIEQSLNEYGKGGWELVSMLETMDGVIAVFKQPLSLDLPEEDYLLVATPVSRAGKNKGEVGKAVEPAPEPAELEEVEDYQILDDPLDEPIILVEERYKKPDPPRPKVVDDSDGDVGYIRIE